MSNNVTVPPVSRRAFLSIAAGAWAAPGLLGAMAGNRRRLSWEFLLPAQHAAALLPAGLELSAKPLLRLDVESVSPVSKNLLEPEDWAWARLMIRARSNAVEGWTPLRLYISNERALRVAREAHGLPATPAQIEMSVEGESLRASITAAGSKVLQLSAIVGPELVESDGETLPLLVWTGRPALDWMSAGGALAGAEIHRVEARQAPGTVRGLDGVDSEWEGAESVTASYRERPASAKESYSSVAAVAKISEADAAPWSPLSYPLGFTQAPAGPLDPARLPPARMKALRQQKEIRLGPLEACELDVMIAQEAHEAMLPPMCRSGGRPMVKMLGLRVHESELSPEPFQEVWLFAFAIVAGRAGWFAVSHITEPQGDAFHGREAFGYPTKLGSPDIVATPLDFQITVNRLGREVAYGRGMFKGFATGTSLGQLPMMTLRAKRGGESAEILYQPWTFQGRRSRVDPATLEVSFPSAKANGMELLSDPWSELNPLRPLAVSAMDGAAMQRGPAETLLEWDGFAEYYRERCDGVLPWEPQPNELPQPTLLVGGTPSGPRS